MQYTFKNGFTVEAKIHANGGGIVCMGSRVDRDCYIGKGSTVYASQIHEGAAVSLSYIAESTIRLSKIMDSTVQRSQVSTSNVSQTNVEDCELRNTQAMRGGIVGSMLRSVHLSSSVVHNSHIDTAHVMEARVEGSQLANGRYMDRFENCRLRDVNTLTGHMSNMDTDAGDRVFNYRGVGWTLSAVKDTCRVSDGQRYVTVQMDRGINDMMETVKYGLSINKDQLDQIKLVLTVNGVLEYGDEVNPVSYFYTPKEAPVAMEPFNHGYRLKNHYVRLLERLIR